MIRLDQNPRAVGEDAPDIIEWPPCDLYSDEPPLETDFHRSQIDLLIRLLNHWWRDGQRPAPKGYRQDFYISGNLTVYYNTQQLKSRDFRGPDVFVVLETEKKDRRSWTVWEEGGKYPNVVIELLSSSKASVDKGTKKTLYQDVWRLPEYYWFHPETLEFAGFHLVEGHYKAIPPNEHDRLPSQQLGLELGIHERQLRWFTAEGNLIPLPEEAERQRADQEQQRADQEQQAKERLENYLRSQGIDPNQLPNG
ncbi:MAG: Uma2 family endonuclease [Leptolyngbyaceae cyanobacterium RM2_2_21]|nr:Uma2 family endonuclease [Leptolyngbyaceae cyanobacterium RM2_2_21]NJN02429.1 Uma2 family endonuclease [Leptolyngbyaceae cyanobacterium RM1_1_2]